MYQGLLSSRSANPNSKKVGMRTAGSEMTLALKLTSPVALALLALASMSGRGAPVSKSVCARANSLGEVGPVWSHIS